MPRAGIRRLTLFQFKSQQNRWKASRRDCGLEENSGYQLIIFTGPSQAGTRGMPRPLVTIMMAVTSPKQGSTLSVCLSKADHAGNQQNLGKNGVAPCPSFGARLGWGVAMFWLQVLLVVVLAIGLPLALFVFIRKKQLSTSPTHRWALRVEQLERDLRRALATAEYQVKNANAEHARTITRDRAEALKKHLSGLELDLLLTAQGIGPSILDSLRSAGFRDVGSVAGAFSLQGVPGIGPEREKTLRATAKKIADSATRDFNRGIGPEAAKEREREARATSEFERAMVEPRRTIAAFRRALENLGPKLALAHQNGSGLLFSLRQPAMLSPDILDAPLPTIDEFMGWPVEPVPMPPSQAPVPLPEPPREKPGKAQPAGEDSGDEFLKPRNNRPQAPPSAPEKKPEDPFDPFAEPDSPPAKSKAPASPASSPVRTQSPGEQMVMWFEAMVDLGLAAAKCDGRVVETERKNLLTALRERFAGEQAVTTHVEIDACLAGREPLELDDLRERLLVLPSDQRRWGYRLCCKVMGPAADRNTRETEFLALLRRMLGLKAEANGNIDTKDPESVLEFDLERDVTPDGIRRQKNLLWDKYDPEKASNPAEAERFKARRAQIDQAAGDLLKRLGAPAEASAPAEDPFAAPGSRHNPDLDDILG